ncbi:MAG: hypothetical protein QG646_3442 [Euryarchaeota archaeon]|nr:hypothetical protein [Euryarchaeota archaeon]
MKAKVVNIEPSTVGEGRIYDQYVFLQLPDGKIFDVFDLDVLTKPEMIDKVKKVTISVSLASISKLSHEKYGLDPAINIEIPTGNGHVFYGKVEEVDERRNKLIVNIGTGKILVSPDIHEPDIHEIQNYSLGDFVRVLAVRADLYNISD